MIRRKWLSLCIALVLCLLLLPTAALAVDATVYGTIEVGGVALTNSESTPTVYAITNADTGVVTIEGANAENYNIMWDGSTLTLKNATIKEAEEYGNSRESMAVYRASGDLAIELVGENTVDALGGGNAASCGINLGKGSLTISGEDDASLTVYGGPTEHGNSCGIYASGAITINSGTVNATGESAGGSSFGIHAYNGTITINGGTVKATSGEAQGDSCGIFAEDSSFNYQNSVTIHGGTVTATAGDAVGTGWYSCGIRVEGPITITGGTVNATGKSSKDMSSYGIYAVRAVTISGGTVTATGGTAAGGESSGIYAVTSPRFGELKVLIQDATVTATGMACTSGISSGIFAESNGADIQIAIENSTVTATGGSAAKGSYGILARTTGTDKSADVTINGNSVVRANMTGENGATISGQPIERENSIVFENGVGSVHGAVVLQEDLTVGADERLTIPQDAALTIPEGVTLTNSGDITNEGTLTNNGTLTIGQGGTLTGEVTGNPVVYTVTVQTDGKGSASASATTAAAGTTVTLTADPDSGYRLARWEVVEGDVTITGNRFIMRAENVTVRAVFSPVVNIPDTHEIELIVGEGGEAKLSLTNASAGSTITVTATPDAGYELDYITVDGERIDGTTFTMPDHDVTVRVYFTDGAALPFTDVSAGAWYFDAVSYVYANGLMDGVSDTLFDPDGTMTRAMVWAILARVDGETVTGDGWIETAREWAVAEGVSDGENANGYVTREQLATMLWRYASGKGYDVSIGEDTNILSYADFADLSEYAIPAMQWACGAGVITGVTDTTLVPQGEATRAQVAAMLMRFVEAIG